MVPVVAFVGEAWLLVVVAAAVVEEVDHNRNLEVEEHNIVVEVELTCPMDHTMDSVDIHIVEMDEVDDEVLVHHSNQLDLLDNRN